MLPRFAATVSRTTRGMSSFSQPESFNATIVNGTKVMSATSFVITIEEKKQSRQSQRVRLRDVVARRSSFDARKRKTPRPPRPAITAMRQRSRARVRKSMYPI